MSSLFDSWFGFIFWGVAFFRMRKVDSDAHRPRNAFLDMFSVALNIIIILTGVMFLTLGTAASVVGIIEDFRDGAVKSVFACASNAL